MSQRTEDKQRADLWLYQARFFKTRALASAAITGGHLRINGARVLKPGHVIRAKDVLTFVQAGKVRVVRVLGLPERRGPAAEAASHYLEIGVSDDNVPVAGAVPERPDATKGAAGEDGLSPSAALE